MKKRQFLVLVTVVGVIYALVILALRSVFGPEAAGAAGLGLTTLAPTLCNKYPRSVAPSTSSPSPSRLSLILLLIPAFIGIQLVAGVLIEAVHRLAPTLFPSLLGRVGISPWVFAMLAATYLIGGALAIVAIPRIDLPSLARAAFLAYALNIAIDLARVAIGRNWTLLRVGLRSSASYQALCLVYVILAIAPVFIREWLLMFRRQRVVAARQGGD